MMRRGEPVGARRAGPPWTEHSVALMSFAMRHTSLPVWSDLVRLGENKDGRVWFSVRRGVVATLVAVLGWAAT